MTQSGRSLYGRILSTVHNEVAACDPGGAIRNEESDGFRFGAGGFPGIGAIARR